MIKVKIRSILAIKEILGKGDLDISVPTGSTLDDLLSSLVQTSGKKLSSHLPKVDDSGHFPQTRVTRIMINGRDIEFLNGLETALRDGDEILILPIISGG